MYVKCVFRGSHTNAPFSRIFQEVIRRDLRLPTYHAHAYDSITGCNFRACPSRQQRGINRTGTGYADTATSNTTSASAIYNSSYSCSVHIALVSWISDPKESASPA